MKILCSTHDDRLREHYIFREIERRVLDFQNRNPHKSIISLGIGDVTLPLPQVAVRAMASALDEMGNPHSMKGYAPLKGYDFLRDGLDFYYQKRNCTVKKDDIFVTDGAKSTIAKIVGLFENANVLLPMPSYPVYRDVCTMQGFAVHEIPGNEENDFLPMPPKDGNGEGYLIFLCSPGNPTGMAYSKEQLLEWVKFAERTESMILFDGAYEAFCTPTFPKSIYEIPGAYNCAIEIGSFSKNAGFTGVRCGWVVLPSDLKDKRGVSLQSRFLRRLSAIDNGVSYISQRGAAAILTEQGQQEVEELIQYYLENAKILKVALSTHGIRVYGGDASPYLWFSTQNYGGSWEFFSNLLKTSQIICTPGIGFGDAGEGFVRFSAFGARETIKEAAGRLLSFSF